jgi:hypothetical protein
MAVKYTTTSPYFSTPLDNGELGFMRNRPIPKLPDDAEVTISTVYHLRPDLLAHDLYKDSRLWWVFASRNPNTLINPLLDFSNGTKIFVPKLSTLREVLGV